MNAWEFVKNIKFGWNLGNTLDASSDISANAKEHETSWGNPVTTNAMVALVKTSGFDVFRVPVSWTKHIGDAPDFEIDYDWMKRVNEVVDYGISNDLYVILNLHHEDWHFPSYENYENAEQRLVKVWQQIAKRFENYDEHLIFEAMNEPRMNNTPLEWSGGNEEARDVINKLNATFVETIRNMGGNNKNRQLMIPTYAASADEVVLKDFIVPDDKNLIVSLHAYTPYLFALSNDGIKTWSKDNACDRKDIDDLFVRINTYFLSKQVPVILGETGARNRDNTNDRVEWAKYYSEKSRLNGVPCIWWDNGLFTGQGELFGLMDRREVTWKYPEVVDAFLGKN